jgi:hypothetical protein
VSDANQSKIENPKSKILPMFRRLILEDHAAIYTIAAFITAASIFGAFLWRALRMQRPQIERFENLPFATATPASVAPRPGDERRPYTQSSARHDAHAE